ncbi:ABC transporter permease [Ancylobacter sonchi]|uniref:ABC transporter permease n=1 Tax=Ancylobacter sonchi TaxID=1937790 RepID=UPI001BD66942|nr:ABC transporter permease [Ancylobacter sonchi]MBS7532434.1 ABC transporter permease [Ancylobacter sonchi]
MNVVSMVVNRLVWFVPTVLGLLAVVFVLARIVPTDPAVLAAGENATAEQVQEARERLALDRPLPEQFVEYLRQVVQGDLGTSFYTQQPIVDDLTERLPATLELTILGVLAAGLIGVPLGVISGLNRNSWLDHLLRLVSVLFIGVAPFWIAMQLQLLFSMQLGWLPLSGRIDDFAPEAMTGFLTIDALVAGDLQNFLSALRHIVLPTLTLALPGAAVIVRFTRTSVVEAVNSPSVAYQTAMGLPRRVIVWKYILRLALNSTVTQLGLVFGISLTGAVVIEAVFEWPGLGTYAVRSILHSDYNAVMGVTLCVGVLFALSNLLVDLLQMAIDPRGAT